MSESEHDEADLTDMPERVADAETVYAVPFDRWLSVGCLWQLLKINERLLSELNRRIDDDAAVHVDTELRDDMVVERGAEIDGGVVIEGPALIAAGASVGLNAHVRGATYVGSDAKVGHSVEVKNSLRLPGATVGHPSYIDDSIRSCEVIFSAGTTVVNFQHDDRPASMGHRKLIIV